MGTDTNSPPSGAGFGPVYELGAVDSTQNAAARAATAGAPHGSVFRAEAQTAGRGRQGHAWASPPGQNLYLSVLLRPRTPVAALLPLTLAAGVAAAEAVAAAAGVRPDLRWPNDLLWDGKKLAGVLLESSSPGGLGAAAQAAILGIGINVNQTVFPPNLVAIATSLRLVLGRQADREALAAELLRQLRRRYDQWAEGGVAALLAAFEQASSYARGRRVRVGHDGGGGASFTGTTAGLDAAGFLRVRRDGAPAGTAETVLGGEVRPLAG